MAYGDQQMGERVMHQAGDADGCSGGWTCSKCGTQIEKLPFKPNPARTGGLLCRDCYREKAQSYGR